MTRNLMQKIRRLEQSKYAFMYTATQYLPSVNDDDLDDVDFTVEFTDYSIQVAGDKYE